MSNSVKLYRYVCCPFCVRVEAILALKNIPTEKVTLGYGDEETPVKLVGVKALPIIEHNGKVMKESLDIVKYIDETFGTPILKPISNRDDIKAWLEKYSKASNSLNFLVTPRLPSNTEFSKKEDLKYYYEKKEKMGNDFKALDAKAPENLATVNQLLKDLEGLFQGEKTLNKDGLSYDDIIVASFLRSMTGIKGIEFPSKVKSYIDGLLANGPTLYYNEQVEPKWDQQQHQSAL